MLLQGQLVLNVFTSGDKTVCLFGCLCIFCFVVVCLFAVLFFALECFFFFEYLNWKENDSNPAVQCNKCKTYALVHLGTEVPGPT